MAYKWDCPHDWLKDHIAELSREQVSEYLLGLAGTLDHDTIQEYFEDQMDGDGYFDEFRELDLYTIAFVPNDPGDTPVEEDGCTFDPDNPDIRSYANSFAQDYPEGTEGVIQVFDGMHMAYSEIVTLGTDNDA